MHLQEIRNIQGICPLTKTFTGRLLVTALLLGAISAVSCGTRVPTIETVELNGLRLNEEDHRPLRTVETFDAAWSIIADTHYDLESLDVDWIDVRAELRPRAEAAESTEEVRTVINEMLDRLGQSHFVLLPGTLAEELHSPEAEPRDRNGMQARAGRGEVGITLRYMDGEVIVTKVRSDSPADRAGVRPGWIVNRIGPPPPLPENANGVDEGSAAGRAKGRNVSAIVSTLSEHVPTDDLAPHVIRAVERLVRGSIGSTVEVEFIESAGEPVAVTMTRVRHDTEMAVFGNLPPMPMTFEAEELEMDGRRIGLIRFSVWMLPAISRIDQAVDRFRDADGIIIDLRGNPGGVGGMSMGVAGHFFDEPTSLGTFRNRGTQLEFLANPRFFSAEGEMVEPYSGPVAILIDQMTGSTSEIFAGGLQAVGRATVFGQTSMGAALPATLSELPNGDMLMHAIADFISPDGTRLEGRGVIPNIEVIPTREDLYAGRDAALEAAKQWIAEQDRE